MKEIFVYKEFGQIKNKAQLKRFFDEMPNGKNLLTQKKANKRTLPQNAWFHSVLPDIRDALREVGYNEVKTVDDAKKVVKGLFFKKIISNGIDEIEIIEGTSDTTKEDFVSRAEEIIIWGKEYLGIDIAPPNTQVTMFY